MADDVIEFPTPPGGHKRKRPSGKQPEGRGTGSKGEGKGTGWGGPAKGAGRGPETLIPAQPPEKVAASEGRKAREAKLAEEMRDIVSTLARTATREETKLTAAIAMLNRIEGAPVQRNINASVDDVAALSDDELERERDQLSAAK